MNKEKFNKMCDELEAEGKNLFNTKGEDYTQESDDRLKNFKAHAKDLKVWCPDCKKHIPIPYPLVCYIYWQKHIDAITTYLNNIDNPNYNPSEPIFNRFVDEENYSKLLLGCIYDYEEEQNAIR